MPHKTARVWFAAVAMLITPALAWAGPSPEDLVARADQLFRAGRFDQAQQAYAEAQERDPASYRATLRLGELALLRNRLAEAEGQLQQAIALRPDENRAKSLLAEVCYRQDRFEEAAALRRDVGPEVLVRKLAGFKGLQPNRLIAGKDVTHIRFVQTDPLPVIKARINGREDVHLLIDTGAAELYLDPEFAESVGAVTAGSTTGIFAGGKKAATGQGRLDSLGLGEFELQNVPVHLLPTRRMPFGPPGVQIEGILGTAVLYHFSSTLDYPGGQLVLRRKTPGVRAELNRLAKAPNTVVVPFWMAGSHFMVAWGRINQGEPVLLFVDTGLAGGGFTCPEETATAAGIDLSGLPTREGIGGGGPVSVTPFTVERLSLGEAAQSNIPAFAGAMPPVPEDRLGFQMDGIISHGFFRPYALTFDFEKMQLLLSKAE